MADPIALTVIVVVTLVAIGAGAVFIFRKCIKKYRTRCKHTYTCTYINLSLKLFYVR